MIIVPVMARNLADAMMQIEAANPCGDAIELRLDNLDSLTEKELHTMIKACKKPCICTCRSKKEGGRFFGSESRRIEVLKKAIEAGAHYVDVEFETDAKLRRKIYDFAKKHKAKVILSLHCTTHTPPLKELIGIMDKMQKEKTHVVKIVTHANTHGDNKVILGLFKDANRKRVKLIAFCMGRMGTDSRILSHFLGAFATFASIEKGYESARGQIPAREMRKHHKELAEKLL